MFERVPNTLAHKNLYSVPNKLFRGISENILSVISSDKDCFTVNIPYLHDWVLYQHKAMYTEETPVSALWISGSLEQEIVGYRARHDISML